MLFALTFDKLVFGTTPNWLSIIGSALILGSAIYVALHKETPVKDAEGREGRGRVSNEEEMDLMGSDARGEADVEDGAHIQLRSLRS